MKKLLALFLTLALCFSVFATLSIGAAEGEEENGNETVTDTKTGMIEIPDGAETVPVGEDTYEVVRTVADLDKLWTTVEEPAEDGTTASKKVVKENARLLLANDLDFGGEALAHMVYTLGANSVLDGNGFSFLNYTQSGGDFGLFTFVNGAVLRNLTLGSATQKIQLTSTGSGKSCGAIVSWTDQTFRLENVHVWADMTVGRSQTAGLVGNLKGSVTFVNCSFHGSIVGDGADGDAGYGGFVGQFQETASAAFENCRNYATVSSIGTGTKHKTAGFIGKANGKNLTMTDCANYGNISTLTGGSVGGFAAESYYGNATPAFNWSLTSCANYGNVTGVGNVAGFLANFNVGKTTAGGTLTLDRCINYDAVSGSAGKVAGLIGNYWAVSATLKLTDCGNYGAINANGSDSGAMLGGAYPNGGSVTVENSFNAGSLTGNGNNKAGVIGSANPSNSAETTVTNFLNTGSISSGSRAAAVTAWFTDNFKITVTGCISLGAISGKSESGGVLARVPGSDTVVKNCLAAASVTTTSGACGVLLGGSAAKATASGNYYMKSGSANTAGGENELTDWAGVAKVLNEKYSDLWGKFMLNTDENGVVPATPKLAGVQDGKSADGTLSVRFISSLQNTLRYERVGFKITVGDNAEKSISCKYVYLKLTATENGAQTEVTAAQLGGTYLYALTVNEIPATGTVTFKVIPFADDMEGTENPQTYLGNGYIVTYVDGVYAGATPISAE